MHYKFIKSDGTEIDSSTLSSFSLTSCVNAESDLKIGSACSDFLDFTLWGSSDIGLGATLQCYKVPDSGEPVKIGEFISEKPRQTSKNVYSVTAYDRMSTLESSCVDWLAKTAFVTGTETYTLVDFAKLVAAQKGIELGDTTALLNETFIVHPFKLDSGTYRLLIQYVAEVGGCFAHMDENGRLAFRWYKNSSKSLAPVKKDSVLGLYAHTHDDYTVRGINAVHYSTSEWEVTAGTGTNVYEIEGNPIFEYAQKESVQQALDNIKSRLALISYVPSDSQILDTTEVSAGDIIPITDEIGNSFSTLVMTATSTAGSYMRITSTGNETKGSSTAVHDSQSKGYTKEEAKRTIFQQMAAVKAELEESIRGVKGGCKVEHYNDDGQIYETLYIDTMDETTAKNVLRINNAGIAFSKNGINGAFTQAISIDGGLVNEWISTWRLTADVVVAGILKSADDGKSFYLNLDTGEFHMKGMATDSDITSAVEANNEQFNLKIKDVNGKYIELKETLDGVTVTTETGKTLINGGSISTDNLYLTRLLSKTSSKSYVEMLENGLNFVLGNANTIGIGYYNSKIPEPYILFGAGLEDNAAADGMIRQYKNGIWIGNSVDRSSGKISGGTGIFVDTVNNIVYKYVNGQPYIMADNTTVVSVFG